MTSSAATRDPTPGSSPATLPREPLCWAGLAALVGCAAGLAGTAALAAAFPSYAPEPSARLATDAALHSGEAFAALSLLGVARVLWAVLGRGGRLAVVAGAALLLALLAAYAADVAYSAWWNTGGRWDSFAQPPFPALEQAALWAAFFLPPAALLPFALAAFAGREARVGALLLSLCLLAVPLGAVR